jgi:hypothetical protein
MMRKCLLGIILTFSVQMTFAQDFKKSYSISANGQIVIWNYRGNIKVEGYKGETVEVEAIKRGPDSALIEIADSSFGETIDIHPRYLKFGYANASVDFEVRVPQSIKYNFNRLSSGGGNLEISNVIGRLRAFSMRGRINVKGVRGLVSASSHSGDIQVEIDGDVQVEIEKDSVRNNMRFTSISGNIEVRAPANFDAFVDMSSMSGLLKTDFPIEVQEMRYGSGQSARGKVGSGKQFLHLRSVQGQVSLIRR